MEPFNKALEVENNQLKQDIAVLKEREGHLTNVISRLSEENQKLKHDCLHCQRNKEDEIALRIENQ